MSLATELIFFHTNDLIGIEIAKRSIKYVYSVSNCLRKLDFSPNILSTLEENKSSKTKLPNNYTCA